MLDKTDGRNAPYFFIKRNSFATISSIKLMKKMNNTNYSAKTRALRSELLSVVNPP